MSGELNSPAPHPPPEEPRRNFPLIVAAASVLVVLAGIFFWPGHSSPPGVRSEQPQRLPFGPEEQSYAAKLSVENLTPMRAENFLQQEITTLSGDLVNNGDRLVANVEFTLEFFDDVHQLVLREKRSIVFPPAPPISPKETRHFEISFEHVPSMWNMQLPSVQVTGLQFATP